MEQMFAETEASFDPSKCKVALLAGGKSNESDISIASSKGAMSALTEAGYQVTQLDPANKDDLKMLIDGGFDVAFLVLHGKGGEDGVIQGFLELIDLPYTGSGIWSSATSINKAKAKARYELANIPTAPSVTIKRGEAYDIDKIVAELGTKCAVKAATEGSSIGVYIVEGKEAIQEAIEEALAIDTVVLVEKYIPGSEYTVAVIDFPDKTSALPVIQIIPKAESYDFESKYQPGGSEHVCPAPLSDALANQMKAYAIAAHEALECAGVSRNDFIIDNDDQMWILETNTLPGMTATSLLPDAARAEGIAFPDLCTILIQNAIKKHNARA